MPIFSIGNFDFPLFIRHNALLLVKIQSTPSNVEKCVSVIKLDGHDRQPFDSEAEGIIRKIDYILNLTA